MIDIDYFMQFNDTYGNLAGDDSLQRVAAALEASVCRPTDLVARYGGEEFGIILPETDAEGARIIAERLRQTVEAAVVATQGSDIRYTISLGIASLRGGINLSAEWLRLADDALYAAKNSGKNRVVCV